MILYIFLVLKMIMLESHNVPLAIFHIHEGNSRLEVDITFDAVHLAEELNIPIKKIDKEYLTKYLADYSAWYFDEVKSEISVSKVEGKEDHLHVIGYFNKESVKTERLRIVNNCLTNVASHSNIIRIDMHEKSADYRMHKNRRTIEVRF